MLNIKHTLFPFQGRDMSLVAHALSTNRKICFQAQTSYGKTFSFCTIAKWYRHNFGKKVLILCHRDELVQQSADTCITLGMTVEKVLPNTKHLHHQSDVYIAMEKTLDNRIASNPRYLNDVGLVIIDEAHSQLFLKHINYFTEQKILGFTATPVLNERMTFYKCDRCRTEYDELGMCCNRELMEWTKCKTMSMYYDDIVVGASVDELIEYGQIVREQIVNTPKDLSGLKSDGKGEYTSESQNSIFGTDECVFDVIAHYEQYALGKKTIIFNPSAKVNKQIYDQFKEKGYNCKIYDSVNEKDGSRHALVKWFEEEDDAILINVNIFTTGFSVKEVQCIILNRAIGSLSLFLQCVGRGARSSTKIFKDYFTVIDLGGNYNRHGRWGDNTRDWRRIFFEGIGAPPRAKKEQPLNVQECKECGMYFSRSDSVCPECGTSVPIPKPRDKTLSSDVLTPLEKLPPPNGKKIADYVARREENIHFGFKILGEYILDMFRHYGVDADWFKRSLASGKVDIRVYELVKSVYFTLIKDERFSGDSNRTIKQVCKVVKKKICKYYNIVVD